jgi:hypothetical protein
MMSDAAAAPRHTVIKIIVLGAANVGKTAIVERYVSSSFTGRRQATVGCSFQTKLLEIVRARHPPGCFPSGLNRRQYQSYQDPDDGDDHQKLDQGKSTTTIARNHGMYDPNCQERRFLEFKNSAKKINAGKPQDKTSPHIAS